MIFTTRPDLLEDSDISGRLQTLYCSECEVRGPETPDCQYRPCGRSAGTQCPVQKAIDALQ